MKLDHNPGHVTGGSGAQYFVGDFDGRTFVPDEWQAPPRWVDWGPDFYCAMPFTEEPAGDLGRTWIAWMSNWDYASDTPTSPWRGAMTLPRRVSLVDIDGRPTLTQQPIETLADLADPVRYAADSSADLFESDGSIEVPESARLQLTTTLGDAERFAVGIELGEGAEFVITYDRASEQLTVDRSAVAGVPNDRFTGVHTAPLVVGDELTLDVIVDRSSVEVFAGGGTVVFTELVFPPAGPNRLRVDAGPVASGPIEVDVTALATD